LIDDWRSGLMIVVMLAATQASSSVGLLLIDMRLAEWK